MTFGKGEYKKVYRVCIDVGGTFTDCVVSDNKGNFTELKSLSTPDDFSRGIMDVLKESALAYNFTLRDFLKKTS